VVDIAGAWSSYSYNAASFKATQVDQHGFDGDASPVDDHGTQASIFRIPMFPNQIQLICFPSHGSGGPQGSAGVCVCATSTKTQGSDWLKRRPRRCEIC